MDPITLALLVMLAGAGTGALTNLHNPEQMWKNAGIGALAGGTLGTAGTMAFPSLTFAHK